jgi:hypothetical protein
MVLKKENHMKKHLMIASLFALIAVPAMAWGNKESKKEWRASLTEEQISCLESHGCPKFTKEEKEGKTDAEMAAKKQCKKAAMEACGIKK